jgi:hypothetical protein
MLFLAMYCSHSNLVSTSIVHMVTYKEKCCLPNLELVLTTFTCTLKALKKAAYSIFSE